MEKKEEKSTATEPEQLLKELDTELSVHAYDPIERKRMTKDLERVRQRLTKGEYFYTDFAGNTFNVPERTREYFIYFNSYFQAARTWAQVLRELDVKRFNSVVDLCPGWAPKIELALFYEQYDGEVILLDRDENSLSYNASFIQLFNPKYRLTQKVEDVFSLNQPQGDLILANHLIDDLLLGMCGHEAGFDPSRIYEDEKAMQEAWDAVLGRRKHFLSKIVESLSDLFVRLVRPSGSLVLTQYQAYMEKLLDLDKPAAFCKEAALATVSNLQARGFKSDPSLVSRCLKGFAGWFQADECFVLQAV